MRRRRIGLSTWAAALLLAVACATTDYDRPRAPSAAFAPSLETRGGRAVARHQADHPGQSAFTLLADGVEALAARTLLADRAERSIDAQYYFILSDDTSRLFIAKLLAAADRGVRVRLLLDDIATQGYDVGMAALDSHPNFEIRIFNPFSRRQGWALDFVTDFGRANHRMHNKSFTVDSVATIVGGRNIGAEYFAAREDVNFSDLDLLAFGEVAQDVGAAFDEYWNSELAIPVTAVVEPLEDPAVALAEGRERLGEALAEFDESRYDEAFESSLARYHAMDEEVLEWATWKVTYDAPEKALDDESEPGQRIAISLGEAIRGAQEEFILVSPYFVPLDSGVGLFRELRERGVRVVVVTNGLAATDVPAVHAGYAAYRKDLLEIGVELYEVRSDVTVAAAERAGMAFSKASLHTKGFIVDRRLLFVGSFNFDPRSVFINTEMGILVDSPPLARRAAAGLDGGIERHAYLVSLDDDGRLRWTGTRDGEKVELHREPDASVWRRFTASFLRLFPIEGQL